MRKIMMKGSFLFISLILVLIITGCIKETYNMKVFLKQAHLSPTLAISGVKGDISLSDIVKANDTVVYDQNKFVTLVFRHDSVIDLKLSDFSKGTLIQKTAIIDPTTFDLNLHNVLKYITGDFKFLNPSIKFNYSNSFVDSIKINLNANGQRNDKTIPLNLAPFTVAIPNVPAQKEVTATYIIDKTNSNLQNLISLPPEVLNFSGTAILTTSTKNNQNGDNILSPNHLSGSLELDLPMELTMDNLQFTDTVGNFLKDNSTQTQDFQFLHIEMTAKNGFPLEVSMKMSLYDSGTNTIKSTVDASGILEPAPIDSNGKASGFTESSTTIEFTSDFFRLAKKADKIIFRFTLNTPGNGSQDVKIYSDYKINFNATLVVKPDISLN
jgi:hypothetical protein